ncbi:MAG: metal-dependent transcriptional regulator [Oscillospiraceae bacterium]|nr:metal-dependent transcriptional regulator [Oscillospiraceae bacterium]
MDPSQFYTLKGYERVEDVQVTSAMEDYLEMICRLGAAEKGPVRIRTLAQQLHVKPSSASKMVSNLRGQGLVASEKYGEIRLTESGRSFGNYLLYRHDLLHRFLCFLNRSQNELEQVEKIEHFVDEKTVRSIQVFLDGLSGPDGP